MQLLVLNVVVPHLKVEVQLSNLLVLLLQFGLRIGNIPDFKKNLLNFIGVDGGQYFIVQLIDVPLHQLHLIFHEDVNINNFPFLLRGLFAQVAILTLHSSDFLN